MITIQYIIFVLGILIAVGCTHASQKETQTDSPKKITVDMLYDLLEEKGKAGYDTSGGLPIYHLASGDILSKEEINAVILHSPTDTTYQLELFTLKHDEWQQDDQILLKSNPVQFNISFEDYDFDGYKDIYVQYAMSNGFAMSYGYLLTIDKESKKLTQHPENEDLGNITPHPNTQTLTSEEVLWCEGSDLKVVCTLTHKWNDDHKLVFEKKECPCD